MIKKWLFSIPTVALILIMGGCNSTPEEVDFWRARVSWTYNRAGCKEFINNYLDSRFHDLTKEPNLIEQGYLNAAKNVFDRIDNIFAGKYLDKNEIGGIVSSYYFYRDFSSDEAATLDANKESHESLWIDNVILIIGDFSTIFDMIAELTKVEKFIESEVAGHKQYKVLYNISNKQYAICQITTISEEAGSSEIQFLYNSSSINDALNYWEIY